MAGAAVGMGAALAQDGGLLPGHAGQKAVQPAMLIAAQDAQEKAA